MDTDGLDGMVTEQDIAICPHNLYCIVREIDKKPFCMMHEGYHCVTAKYYKQHPNPIDENTVDTYSTT